MVALIFNLLKFISEKNNSLDMVPKKHFNCGGHSKYLKWDRTDFGGIILNK